MAQDLALATASSPSLKRALALIENAQPGEPLSISSRTKSEARTALAAADAVLQPAPRETVERWLEALGVLVAGNPSEGDAARRVQAFAAMLEFPAAAFCRRSLDAAARRFRFFPAYAELTELLEAETADAKRRRFQLRRLVALPVADPEPAGTRWSALSDDQRAELDRLLAPFRRPRGEPDPEGSTAGPEIRPPVSETGPTL